MGFADKPCQRCGAVFSPTGANSRWCSDECCRGLAVCQHCDKSFVPGKKTARKFCSRDCWDDALYPVGAKQLTGEGYVIVKVPKGTPGCITHGATRDRWIFVHRYVVQQRLGRPLLKTETVHHRNGNKQDNADENLELWASRHGRGQRVAEQKSHCPTCTCFD